MKILNDIDGVAKFLVIGFVMLFLNSCIAFILGFLCSKEETKQVFLRARTMLYRIKG